MWILQTTPRPSPHRAQKQRKLLLIRSSHWFLLNSCSSSASPLESSKQFSPFREIGELNGRNIHAGSPPPSATGIDRVRTNKRAYRGSGTRSRRDLWPILAKLPLLRPLIKLAL